MNQKNPPPPLLSSLFLLSFFTAIDFALPNCILNTQLINPSSKNPCNETPNWDGFMINTDCCKPSFESYLRALAIRANETGKIFLNSTEQRDCLPFSCSGIGKLTGGVGGCSDYSVGDVVNKLGDRVTSLGEGCRVLGSDFERENDGCGECLGRWREMGKTLKNGGESMKMEGDVCRFAVLVSLASQRANDEKWMMAVFGCLRENRLSLDDQGGKAGHKVKLSTGLWMLIAGGLAAGFIVIILFALWMLYRKAIKAKIQEGINGTRTDDSKYDAESSSSNISIKQVYSATNNLSPSNFIGQGIAGKVYRGILSNGEQVAVKHIINDGQMETFVREVTSVSHVRHPNLVALLGHYQGHDEYFLVYELCHNGNLSEWLFGKDKVLSWIRRLEIAMDCASGLLYLHAYPQGCIVHRDIKPTNILISANFKAKLSDFGLSKVINMGQSYVSSEVRGTFGYVDPEYQKNRHVNSSGDVYSYGVVLLQLLSGQRIINLDLKKPMPLGKTAKMVTRAGGSIAEFADPRLNGEYSKEAFEMVLKLGLSCTGVKQLRPSMERVIPKLQKALQISTALKPIFSTD